jgi:hypothetical protein
VLRLPEFNSADELRAALGSSKQKTRLSGSYVHLISTGQNGKKRHQGRVII